MKMGHFEKEVLLTSVSQNLNTMFRATMFLKLFSFVKPLVTIRENLGTSQGRGLSFPGQWTTNTMLLRSSRLAQSYCPTALINLPENINCSLMCGSHSNNVQKLIVIN